MHIVFINKTSNNFEGWSNILNFITSVVYSYDIEEYKIIISQSSHPLFQNPKLEFESENIKNTFAFLQEDLEILYTLKSENFDALRNAMNSNEEFLPKTKIAIITQNELTDLLKSGKRITVL